MADLFFWLEDVDNQHIGMDITRVNLFFLGGIRLVFLCFMAPPFVKIQIAIVQE